MPTTTRSFCAIIQLPSLLGSGSKPMQLFGLRKTPDLSLALPQARSPWVGTGSVPATGGWSATARSHILPNFSDTRSDCKAIRVRGTIRAFSIRGGSPSPQPSPREERGEGEVVRRLDKNSRVFRPGCVWLLLVEWRRRG